MKEWTLEERYRVLEGPEDIKDLYERISTSTFDEMQANAHGNPLNQQRAEVSRDKQASDCSGG